MSPDTNHHGNPYQSPGQEPADEAAPEPVRGGEAAALLQAGFSACCLGTALAFLVPLMLNIPWALETAVVVAWMSFLAGMLFRAPGVYRRTIHQSRRRLHDALSARAAETADRASSDRASSDRATVEPAARSTRPAQRP